MALFSFRHRDIEQAFLSYNDLLRGSVDRFVVAGCNNVGNVRCDALGIEDLAESALFASEQRAIIFNTCSVPLQRTGLLQHA